MSTEIKNWPVEYKQELLLGDLGKSIAICTLWSDREFVAGRVGVENAAVFGNLYSHGPGIEGIVRNILANPAIRTIVLAGKDKSRSAETLAQFFNNGVEKTDLGWTINRPDAIGENDLPPGMRTIDEAIPIEAIETLRRSVEVIDLRGKSWQEVGKQVANSRTNIPFAEPAVYPKTESKVEIMKGEDVGFVFRGDKPEEVWLEILRTIRQFGHIGETQWTSNSQEVLNMVATLDGDMGRMMSWPNWVGHSPESVVEYSKQLIKGVALDSEDSYAYGERMRVRKGDQIGFLIEQLKEKPHSRSMVVDLWDVEKDWFGRPESPPCLTQAWFRMFQGKLCLTVSYRSNDMYGAWIKNVTGDRLLQSYVAQEAGVPLGSTTIISYSAHIYEHDFAQIDSLLKQHPLRWQFIEDPRGNFIITVEDAKIVTRHENRSGAITILKGISAQSLYKEIWARKLLLLPEHAMYIGSELNRAEESIRHSKDFIQDEA